PRDDPCPTHRSPRPGRGGGSLRGGLSGRTLRTGVPRRPAVPQGRGVPEPRGAGRRPGRAGAPAAPHGDRGDRQPGQGSGGTGDPEHERDAGAGGDGGARVLKVRVVVLGGPANRAVVAALRAVGLDAIGLSGVDGGLLTAQPSAAALGHVGEISAVRASLLESLLLAGLTPVVAPVAPAAGREGVPLNV